MKKVEVYNDILQIFQKNFSVNVPINTIRVDKPLTGEAFGINGMQLYRLLMQIETKYCIYFTPNDFHNSSFNSIDSIAEAIIRKLNKQTVF